MKYKMNDEFIINKEVEDEKNYFILYNPISEAMFVLNETAHEVYKLFFDFYSIDEIIKTLNEKYVLSSEDLDKINEIINFMLTKGIIYVDD